MPLFSLQGSRLGGGLKAEAKRPTSANASPLDKNSSTQPDDGSNKADVPAEIRLSDKTSYQIGDRVEARYRGRGRRFYKGKVSNVLDGDRYDISYDDGDKDRGLSAEFIRRLPATNSSPEGSIVWPKKREESVAVAAPSAETARTFDAGQRVEAKYRNRGRRYYKGTIADVLGDGLYNIDYDDGDKDRSLPAAAIRALTDAGAQTASVKDAKSPLSTTPAEMLSTDAPKPPGDASNAEEPKREEALGGSFVVGQPVEARYKGRGRRWYKGSISECLGDGSYNIAYRDGDKDFGLRAEFIRALDTASPGDKIGSPPSSAAKSIKSSVVEPPSSDVSAPPVADASLPEEETTDEPKESTRSQRQSAFVSMSAAEGDVSFVAPIDAGRKIAVEEKPDSDPGDDVFGELSSVAEAISDKTESEDSAKEEPSIVQTAAAGATANPETAPEEGESGVVHGKGNRLYRGVVSKVRVVHLYEVDYPDGTKDVNLPFQALRVQDGVAAPDIQVGASVDVLSWQDRFWSQH